MKINFLTSVVLGVVFLIMFVVLSCTENKRPKSKLQIEAIPTGLTYLDFNGIERNLCIYTFRGHQYIGQLNGWDSDLLTHLADCNNPTHNTECKCKH